MCVAGSSYKADKTLLFSSALNSIRQVLEWACSPYVCSPSCKMFCTVTFFFRGLGWSPLRWCCRMHSQIHWGSETMGTWMLLLVLFMFGAFLLVVVFSLFHIFPMVSLTNCLEIFRAPKCVFPSLQNKTHGCKTLCSTQLFFFIISFFFFVDFFPSKANQGRKLLVSLVLLNVENLSTNPVRGKY